MLKNTQKRYLKSLAHSKKPVVIIGAKGLTQAVLEELDIALDHHELVKIRVNAADRDARIDIINHLCTSLRAQLIQRIGHVATLFRRNPESPKIALP